jgi:hypothetical protein
LAVKRLPERGAVLEEVVTEAQTSWVTCPSSSWCWVRRRWVLEALREAYGPVPQQRYWVNKTANVLHKLPKAIQSQAKLRLQ